MDNRALSSELVAAELRDAIRRSRASRSGQPSANPASTANCGSPEIQLARLIVTLEELADRLEEA